MHCRSLAGTSEYEMLVRVRDTLTGRTWAYFSAGGAVPAAVRDVDALPSCP